MIVYLSKSQVLALHAALLEATGGSDGLREEGLLESALARPAASFAGSDLYPTLSGKTSALMHSLVSNHPFVDGNKRIAVAAAELFLAINGYRLSASDDDLETFTLAAAEGSLEAAEMRIWFQQHMQELKHE